MYEDYEAEDFADYYREQELYNDWVLEQEYYKAHQSDQAIASLMRRFSEEDANYDN